MTAAFTPIDLFWAIPLGGPMIVMLIWAPISWARHQPVLRHARCLQNIARLEPEVFPDLPPEVRWVEWRHVPRSKHEWTDDPVNWVSAPSLPQRSAAYAAHVARVEHEYRMHMTLSGHSSGA